MTRPDPSGIPRTDPEVPDRLLSLRHEFLAPLPSRGLKPGTARSHAPAVDRLRAESTGPRPGAFGIRCRRGSRGAAGRHGQQPWTGPSPFPSKGAWSPTRRRRRTRRLRPPRR